jgi:rhodanese-related sulfurtransferase
MIQNLSPHEVKRLLDTEKNVKLIDVREKWEYEYATIEGAENIPLSVFVHSVNKIDNNNKIILYCHHGSRSYQACSYLVRNGFNDVTNMDGGIDAWADQVEPSMQRY